VLLYLNGSDGAAPEKIPKPNPENKKYKNADFTTEFTESTEEKPAVSI